MLGGFLRKKCTLLSIQLEIINFDAVRKHYFSFLKGLPKGFAYNIFYPYHSHAYV